MTATVTHYPVSQPLRRRTTREVAHLGWLLRHAAEANHAHIVARGCISRGQRAIPAGGCVLVTYGARADGSVWAYRTIAPSMTEARGWVTRPSLSHIRITEHRKGT